MAKEATPAPVVNLKTSTELAIKKLTDYFGDPANKNGHASNLDLHGLEGVKMLTKLHGKADVGSDDIGNDTFPTKWFYAHLVELREQATGEVHDSIRLVLISPDKKTLSFVSNGAVDSLDLIRSCMGDGPYDPPLPIKVVRQKTRGGSTVLRLIME